MVVLSGMPPLLGPSTVQYEVIREFTNSGAHDGNLLPSRKSGYTMTHLWCLSTINSMATPLFSQVKYHVIYQNCTIHSALSNGTIYFFKFLFVKKLQPSKVCETHENPAHEVKNAHVCGK